MPLSFILHLPLESGTPLEIHVSQVGGEQLAPVPPRHAKKMLQRARSVPGTQTDLGSRQEAKPSKGLPYRCQVPGKGCSQGGLPGGGTGEV